jgi:hypothetical protein
MVEGQVLGITSDDVDSALVKPPAPMLMVGAIASLASLILFVWTTHFAQLIGYVLGTFVTILAISLFRRGDARRSSSPLYSPVPWMNRVAIAVLLIGIVCGVVHIYYLAQRVTG